MYLMAERYIGGWRHSDAKESKQFSEVCNATGVTPSKDAPSFTVSANVGYWRKANAVHAWFVKNIQDGVDECQKSHVNRDQLTALRDACNQVLNSVETVSGSVSEGKTYYPNGRIECHSRQGEVVAQAGLAEKMMPTQSGFFFGKTEYDEDYLNDLRDTVEIVDRVLSDPALEHYSFYYQASW